MNFINVCLQYLSKLDPIPNLSYSTQSNLLDIVIMKDDESTKVIVFPNSITIVDEYGCTRYSETSIYSPEDIFEILDEIILGKSRSYE